MDLKDDLILKMGDELLRMSRQLSFLAEKKMPHGSIPPGIPVRSIPIHRPPAVLDVVPPKDFEDAVRLMLTLVGEDPTRPGLKETPARFRRAWEEMLSGYSIDVKSLFKTFSLPTDEMIVVKDIPFTSLCEHHLLPFTGVAHVAYIAATEIIGLSKVARIVLAYAKRLQVQEQLTKQITEAFSEYMPNCQGSACVIKASHTCMACRGVRVSGASMITNSLTGVFREKPEARAEFMSCINGG